MGLVPGTVPATLSLASGAICLVAESRSCFDLCGHRWATFTCNMHTSDSWSLGSDPSGIVSWGPCAGTYGTWGGSRVLMLFIVSINIFWLVLDLFSFWKYGKFKKKDKVEIFWLYYPKAATLKELMSEWPLLVFALDFKCPSQATEASQKPMWKIQTLLPDQSCGLE